MKLADTEAGRQTGLTGQGAQSTGVACGREGVWSVALMIGGEPTRGVVGPRVRGR